MTAGQDLAPLETAAGRIGVLICLESVYPQDAAVLVDRGAELLVVTTDDAGFERSPLAEFHARRSALRAVETGRYVVHVSQAGPSYVFDPHGAVVASRPLFQKGLLRATVRRLHDRTLYQQTGDVLPVVVWMALMGLAGLGLRRSRRRATP